MAAKKNSEVVVINPLEMNVVKVKIVGDTPLIMHAWSVKARREMLEKQLNLTKTKARDVKNPVEDFCTSAYWLTPMPTEFEPEIVDAAMETGRFGFPVTGFKQATLSASSRLGWGIAKTVLNTAFFIEKNAPGYYSGELKLSKDKKSLVTVPNVFLTFPMIEIFSDKPVMREDMVRVGGISKSADIRYRSEFRNWWAEAEISYNAKGPITIDQILNALNAAGRVGGVGEWRCEKGGDYGSFHVEAI